MFLAYFYQNFHLLSLSSSISCIWEFSSLTFIVLDFTLRYSLTFEYRRCLSDQQQVLYMIGGRPYYHAIAKRTEDGSYGLALYVENWKIVCSTEIWYFYLIYLFSSFMVALSTSCPFLEISKETFSISSTWSC